MQQHLVTILLRAHGIWDREEGQASVEYGILAALIIAVSVAIITTLGNDVSNLFNSVVTAL